MGVGGSGLRTSGIEVKLSEIRWEWMRVGGSGWEWAGVGSGWEHGLYNPFNDITPKRIKRHSSGFLFNVINFCVGKILSCTLECSL